MVGVVKIVSYICSVKRDLKNFTYIIMANISFLHFSDLHIGDKHQMGLISQTKKILFEDIEFILSKINTLDVVFFTGDLVQKGTKEEFIQFEEFLKEMWELFEQKNQNPYLLCVPGNHDLDRITDYNNPAQKVLTDWVTDNLKDDYFWKSPNPYHDYINERFKNYIEWYQSTSIRKPENIHTGYLPGDFYASLNLHDVKLGIVGLNSSFLQLYSGDAMKKLGIYNKQINHLFLEKYTEWIAEQDLPIILTHHSPEWFEPKALTEFNQEIYFNESYLDHLCGHMHEPSCTTTSQNGFPSKRLFISPSLFGLEYYGDNSTMKRIHGYTAGNYTIESGKISKTIWPRISFRTKHDVLKISQNEDFNLEKDSSSLTEIIFDTQKKTLDNSSNEESISFTGIEKKSENLFAQKAYDDSRLVRSLYKGVHSHLRIRFEERNAVVSNLTNNKYCWISTKFGLGEDEFIGSLLNQTFIDPGNCFSINCDEVSTVDQLIDIFNKIFSINITKFFDIINTLNHPLLVFSNINEDLAKNTVSLKNFIQPIFDFSPNLRIIIISEIKPDNRFFNYVELCPLDIPAVIQYIEHSQELHSSFTFLEYEKIHRISSGIPFYIDKVIEQLKFRPLSDLGDMEFDISSNNDADNKLSRTVKNEINLLRADESKQGSRRFTLLLVMSLLHNGETFERIRRYDSTKPFQPDDISHLLKNRLVETVQVNSIFDDKQIDSELVKIIRVPRIIRDYVSSLLTVEEKVDIYKLTCNLYLGSNWRNSIKLIHSKDVELDLIIYQNLQIAIRFILSNGIENSNELETTRMTGVAMSLIEYFSLRGAYKDAISLAEEILLLIKDVQFEGFENTKTHLTKSLGENLRMTSLHDKSITILKSVCDDENNALSKKDRNYIRISIAYAYETLNHESEAISYSNLVKKNEKDKNSRLYLAAESVIAGFIQDNPQKISKLKAIKVKADKLGFTTLKANLLLQICGIEKDENQLKQLDKIILESKNDTYNKVRALVVKADIILSTKKINEITNNDLLGLNIAYSYTFYQRLQPLLSKCHSLAWKYWHMQNQFDQLLNLFRYSSFVWRLCGSIEQEQKYIDELHSNQLFIEWFKTNKNNINSIYYEQRIFALYNNGNENSMITLNESNSTNDVVL